MTQHRIRNEHDREMFAKLAANKKPPFTATIRDGDDRSIEQNKLQRMWMNEIEEQRGDQTAEEWRGYCKLRFGVPILRADDEEFCEKYDRIIKPHPYEVKVEMMMEPLDFPVTRLMTTRQKTRYLDAIYAHFTGIGVRLTRPNEGAE